MKNSSLHGDQFFWTRYALSGQDGVFNWDDKTPALPVLFAQAALVRPDFATGHNKSSWTVKAEQYLDRIISGKGRGLLTEGGHL
ncbi:hypothetical protein JB92DRAFT_1308334 [Gautieria morchelliformis]|nr:hypothetical protein JB92DRAFT_1308334 [Gautieria morchelliformis]